MSRHGIGHLGRLGVILVFPLLTSCMEIPRGSSERNDLAALATAPISVNGKATYTAYVADENTTRQFGLMNVTEAELPTDRGMIFVFESDQLLSFWMRNTIIPLDIAYIRSDGLIVKTYTMEPLNEAGYPSIEAAQFALEVRAGQFEAQGIQAGDRVTIPEAILGN